MNQAPPTSTSPPTGHVIVGCFGSVYGVQGWIRVNSYTDPIEQIIQYDDWQSKHQGHWQAITVNHYKQHGKQLIVKLSQCDDRELARSYTNNLIAIPRSKLPQLEPGEYYWSELIGLRVENLQGITLGHIDHCFDTGSNDVLVLKGERQRMLPYTDDVVSSIDLSQGIMVVNWDPDF